MGGYMGVSGGNKIPSGYRYGQLEQFTPDQFNLFKQLFSQVSPESYTSRLAGGDQGLFDEMERPAMRQFNEFQGNLASRFSGMGMGSRRGSGFQNQATQAASDFAGDLQSRRQGMQRQAIQDLMGMSQSLLGQRPYEQQLVQKPQRQGMNWGGLVSKGLMGAATGLLTGGPAGAALGGFGGAASGASGGIPQSNRSFLQ